MDRARTELLIVTVYRLLEGCRTIAVGNSSPIPGSAALLLGAKRPQRRVLMLGSKKHNAFTDGGRELFDCAAQGRIDAFFLGGGQIDGQGNINLVGLGPYPRITHRFPGSFGSAFLYYVVPRVILFREEHTPRVMVPKVDFVSAPGVSESDVYRPGGPHALVTGRCVFTFDKRRRRFRLESVHSGESVDSVRQNTGFEFDVAPDVAQTPPLAESDRALLRGRVAAEIAETYPRFARALFDAKEAAE
ncbi:MAG TPA: CoA-transferase [Alphaproteobacteria bacterium]|nr:CoA-transferase [Alphaproteobacteria bacterium]